MEAAITKRAVRGKKNSQSKADKSKELERLRDGYLEELEIIEAYEKSHLWEFFKPFQWQDNISSVLRRKMIVAAPCPNGVGKTTVLVCTLASWAAGYEAWNEVEADYSGAVKHKGKWYKSSSLGIKPPVRLRLTGDDWNHHLGQVVVPEMKKWFSMEDWITKKNTSGVDYFWTHKPTGSTIECMTHDQDLKLFEAWRGHGWGADEPSKFGIFKAMSRGLAENRGKMFFPSTPLSQAWMLDELILKNRSDVGVVKDLTLFDNEISFLNDVKILDELGLFGKTTKYWRESNAQKKHFFELLLYKDDLGVEAEKYLRGLVSSELNPPLVGDVDSLIMRLIFLKRAKDTSLDEKPCRFFGMFKKLVGLIFKEFDRVGHILPAGGDPIPTNWIVTFEVDFHLGKPHAIAFYACSERNIHYVIEEVWENMTPEEIACLIIRKKKVDCWNIDYGEIDALSKGDDKYMKNRDAEAKDAFTIIEKLLEVHGIELGVASKDMKSGYTNIKSWLKGPNKIPVLYFLDSLQSIKDNTYGHIYEILRLCYDENGIPEKKDNHFMECLYRYTNAGIEYKERSKTKYCHQLEGTGVSEGWMGS